MLNLINSLSNNRLIMKSLSSIATFSYKRIPYKDDNPFLKGVFAPIKQENFVKDLEVIGTIPPNLDGLFLRIGPNPVEVKNPTIYNWFMGDGMVHALRIKDGNALWFKNSYVGTHQVNDQLKRPHIKGQPRGLIDLSNTNIIGHANKLWAMTEAGPLPVSMNFELESLSYTLFNSHEKYEFSAHPHKDPDTEELHAICYDALSFNNIHYQVISKEGLLKKRVSIPVKHGPMIHDCGMTSSKMVIFDLPITFSMKSLIKGSNLPYAWNDQHEPRIGVLPKDGDAQDIQWFKIDPCFVFHSCNAYDLENGDVVIDVPVHDKTFVNSIQGPIEQQVVRFERWLLDSTTGTIKRTIISNIPQEFPRFDERLTGKPYRYAYAISLAEEGENGNPADVKPNYLLRHDLHTGETIKRSYGDGYVTGEAIFIPRTADSKEDEGWIISYVHSIDCKETKIVILDAQNIEGEPQAVISLPIHVPLGFHSNWVSMI